MILMGFCYTKMGRHLWGTPIIGEATPQLLKNYESKKKVRIIINRILLIVVYGNEALFRFEILLLLSNAN